MAATRRKKLVLAVIDAMSPAMLHETVAAGRAPTLAELIKRGAHVDNCVSAFPSVTPICAASITTGQRQDRHGIAAMNWYHRGQGRYVEYGTSFRASQAVGFKRSLTDTIYNMNAEHLSRDVHTVFESLDDDDLRTAATTFLIYRGRHVQQPADDTALTRLAATVFRHPVNGPRELFYADLFASQRTSCRSQFGLPYSRDPHAGCVGAHLVEQDLFDFLLLSLPDNDSHSHRQGPAGQIDSIPVADAAIGRVMDAGGGIDAFLEDHAVIVCSDHAQTLVTDPIDLFAAFDGFNFQPATNPRRGKPGIPDLAVCPNSRAAQIYALGNRRRAAVDGYERVLRETPGVELTMRLTDHPDGEVAIRRQDGELRFSPGGKLVDLQGRRWSVEGDLDVLELSFDGDQVASAAYPDAFGRVWAALRCRTAGDVFASAASGHEFVDWGGSHHVGGGSHGSLHSDDSNASLLWCGTGPESAEARPQWLISDIAELVRGHFGLPSRLSFAPPGASSSD
ncbi:MAG: alkaline phosphatase family protein [Actinomycetota bacterium]|nr:alkaline phosphatase family protein [Actinomycetota bacterium]